jgi:type IV pilus assembly PilX-like protein
MNTSERGVAIILALMTTLLLSALTGALILLSSSEALIAANFRNGREALYAADAAIERALVDLSMDSDWNDVLAGAVRSDFVDGPPSGTRALADSTRLDLGEAANRLNCRKTTPCLASDLAASTAVRPWGANNPVWQLFAYGPLSNLLPDGAVRSAFYVIVFAGDDASENDNDPLHDGGDAATNAGSGVIMLHAESFGPRAAHAVVEAVVARRVDGAAAVRIVSWRALP